MLEQGADNFMPNHQVLHISHLSMCKEAGEVCCSLLDGCVVARLCLGEPCVHILVDDRCRWGWIGLLRITGCCTCCKLGMEIFHVGEGKGLQGRAFLWADLGDGDGCISTVLGGRCVYHVRQGY